MKFIVLIYNDGTLLNGLPSAEADGMMRDCLSHADELQTIDIDSEIVEEYAGDEAAVVEDVIEEIEELDGGFEEIAEDAE